MAISTKGVLEWTLYEKGGSDHLRLIEFLGKVIKNKKNKLILMDNASCHRNQEVKDYITNKKNDLIHILTYHHFQNTIEKLFNQLKNFENNSLIFIFFTRIRFSFLYFWHL